MKLSKRQIKKLHRKLKVKTSAENLFVKAFIDQFEAELKQKIEGAASYAEVKRIIKQADFKGFHQRIKILSDEILKRNNDGYKQVIEAMMQGAKSLKKQKEYEKKFAEAVPKLIQNKEIYTPFMQIFEKNMSLIKDLPEICYEELRKGYLEGKSFRASEVERLLVERMGNRARLIARTESAKVNAALTETRSMALGIKAFVWATSEDRRVRDTHALMDGVLVFYGSIIELDKMFGYPGMFPNCRCVQIPIVELEDISFPIKVASKRLKIDSVRVAKGKYRAEIKSGSIKTYNKTQFLATFGKELGFIEGTDNKRLRI